MNAKHSFRFIEIAANLTDEMFQGVYHGKKYHAQDIESVLSRSWAAGVDRIIVTGGSLEESRAALALAATDARLYCTVGVHPTRCMEFEQSDNPEKHLEELKELAILGAAQGKVVAIGECGLDYDRLQFCPKEVQRKWFERQLSLSEATNLPMFLHMRGACQDFLHIFAKYSQRVRYGVVHSFTGTAQERDSILRFPQLFIGINGCSLKTEDNLGVMEGIPLDRVMLETDSPYCDVRPTHAGFHHVATTWPCVKKEKHNENFMVKGRNEPCSIRQVFEVVAGQRKESDPLGFSQKVYENTCKVFFPHDLDTLAGVVVDESQTL